MKQKLDMTKLDCEERFGISSSGGLAAGRIASLVLGILFSAVFYAALSLLRLHTAGNTVEMFFPGGAADRTLIPALTVFLAMYALGMILVKRSKLKMQQRALELLPVCSRREMLAELQKQFHEPGDFIAPELLAKQLELDEFSLTMLEKNNLLDSRISDIERDSEISFIPVTTLIWAIPVLGFIGTVLGLARAVGNFGGLLNSGTPGSLSSVLPEVTGGLGTAFETTLIALVSALLLQLISSRQNHAEAAFICRLKRAIIERTELTQP